MFALLASPLAAETTPLGAKATPVAAFATMAHRQRGPRNDVFVGNIAFGTTDEDIRRIFSEVGRVKNVRMAVNSETGKPRGFCFVE